MKQRIRNGFRNGDGNKYSQSVHTNGRRYERKGSKKEGLILSGRMKAQMGSGIQVVIIIKSSKLMGLKMRRRIKRKNMMLMIKLMSEYFAIKCPDKSVRQHADEQHKHDGMDKTLVHE